MVEHELSPVYRDIDKADSMIREFREQRDELLAAYNRYIEAHDAFEKKMDDADWDQYERMAKESAYGDTTTESMHQELVFLTDAIQHLEDKLQDLTEKLFGIQSNCPDVTAVHPYDKVN